jgi:hypothetical protein
MVDTAKTVEGVIPESESVLRASDTGTRSTSRKARPGGIVPAVTRSQNSARCDLWRRNGLACIVFFGRA